jgi:hypothetical protein
LVLFESYRKKKRGNNRKRENIDIKKKPINEDKKKKTIPYQLGLKNENKKNKTFIKEFKKIIK